MKWLEATLGIIVEADGGIIQTGPFGSQLHQQEYQTDGVPVIMPKDISEGRVLTESVARVSEQTADRLARHKLQIGAIVLPRRGEIAKRAFIRVEQEGWLCGTGCLKIELNAESRLSPEFLYYYMEQDSVARWLEQHAVGTTMLNLNTQIVADLPIRYPRPDVQREIVCILSAYDDLIENNRRRIGLLEESARLLYREWFVCFRFPGHEHVKITNGVPNGWETKILGDVAYTNSESYQAKQLPDEINYIDISSVERGRIVAKSVLLSSEAPGRARRKAKDGDVIWSNVRPNLRAYALILEPETNDVFSTGFTILSPRDIPFTWLYMFVTTENFVGHLVNHATGAGYPAVRPNDFERAPVIVPPNGLLRSFHEATEPSFRLIARLETQNQKLSEARDILLPRLMNGEIAV